MLASLSFPAERKSPLPKLQMWNTVLSMMQYSQRLPNFRFRLCASFHGGSVFRDPPCTGTGTSCNHFASWCDIFDGSPTFRRQNRSRSGSRWQSNYGIRPSDRGHCGCSMRGKGVVPVRLNFPQRAMHVLRVGDSPPPRFVRRCLAGSRDSRGESALPGEFRGDFLGVKSERQFSRYDFQVPGSPQSM
jgi:hypothetical protein